MYTYKRVALIGVDGAGNFFRQAETPNIDRIFASGSVAYDVYTSSPSISAECWGSMLHGVTPDLHRLTNGIVGSVPYDVASPFPSVFRTIRENDADCELASFCNWNPINVGIIEQGLGVHEDTAGDAALCDKICAYLEEHDPKLLFVQFDEVDGAGHRNGYGTAAHLAQITVTDGYVGRIWEAYEKRGFLEDTLFIVTADHGGFGTSHGGNTEEEMRVMYALCGKTVAKNAAAVDMQIRDCASVVLHALGYAQSENWTSIVPTGVFEGVEATARPEFKVAFMKDYRVRGSVPTPTEDVSRLFGKDDLKAYFPFDGDGADATGRIASAMSGKMYYLDGYFGKGARMDDGCFTLDGISFGDRSFSLALWIKTGGFTRDPVLLSNKNWKSGKNPGFVMSLCGVNAQFNCGDGQNRCDFSVQLPLDFKDGWVYVVLSVDREANTVGGSVDFAPLQFKAMPEALRGVSLDTEYPARIGQDGTGEYPHRLSALIDEMVIVDHAVTDEEIVALKEFYTGEG